MKLLSLPQLFLFNSFVSQRKPGVSEIHTRNWAATIIQAICRCGTGSLYVPRLEADVVQSKLPGNFGWTHGVRYVLLIGIHQDRRVPKLF